MATPAWATDLTDFYIDGASTVTAIGTGAAALGNPETDFFIQGSSCISKGAWTNATKGFIIDALGANFTVPTDGCVIVFAKYDAAGSLDLKSNGGLQVIIGSAVGAYYHYYVGGSDTLAFNSWIPYAIDPNTATVDNTTGSPAGTERWVGVLATLPTTSGPTKGNPIGADAIRYGRGTIEYTAGDVTFGYNTFAVGEGYANDPTRRWGLIELLGGAYQIQGFHSLGTASTAVDFRDSNKVLFFRATGANNTTNDAVSTAFNRIEILNSSSNVDWDNISISALGTRARGVFVHTAGSFDATSCQFTDMATFTFLSTTVATDCVFRRTDTITAPGSTLNGSQIISSRVAADAAALIWNVATDPDGKLDDMSFTMGTNAHHAIELGASAPSSVTLRGWTVTGFSASDGNNDSVIYNTSGKAITVYAVGASGTISYKNSGAGSATTVIADPVTIAVHAQTVDGTDVQDVRVLLETSDGTGPFPYQDVVTISNSGTTATVTHTAHGMADNDYIVVRGASLTENNGPFQITFISANSYSYTMGSSPGSSPTGTILVSFVALFGLTDVNGDLSTSRVYPSAQPITGKARKSTSAPYYKTAPLGGTVSNTLGFTTSAIMILDQ